MPYTKGVKRKGYWWECDKDRAHWEPNFAKMAKVPLVKFFYDLAESAWDQNRLSAQCPICRKGQMFITYDFPRSVDPVRLSVIHVIGLKNNPAYLPMLWETIPHNESERWIDFKYVGRNEKGHYQNLGLSRPAVFTRSSLEELFALYKKVVGRSLLNFP